MLLDVHCLAVAVALTVAIPAQERPVTGTVDSKDGTTIAFEITGKGPPLILVAPALADRTDHGQLAALLAPSFRVINYDRRGRGASGTGKDGGDVAVQREVEDIEALAALLGEPVFLFGSSSGAVLALEAASALGDRVRAAVLFEPPFLVDDSRPPVPADLFDRIASMLAEGHREGALRAFMVEAVGVPEDMVAAMAKAPMWAKMSRLAGSLPNDGTLLAGLQGGQPLPEGRWRSCTARLLVIDGELSPLFLRNAAEALVALLPSSRRVTLAGRDHSAVFTAPHTLLPAMRDFLLERSPSEEPAGRRGG